MSFCIFVIRDCGTYDQKQRVYFQPSNVTYDVDINGRFATCALNQTFTVDRDTTESEYKFPLDANSALCELTVVTPRETIRGVVKEKAQAKQDYETGRKEGRQSFLG